MSDRNGSTGGRDLGMKKEERIGEPPRATPTVKEVPPTDEELKLIDRLRQASAIGRDAFMIAVMSGNDITKPTTINAVLNIIQQQDRHEKGIQQLADETARRLNDIRGTLSTLGKDQDEENARIHELIGKDRAKAIEVREWAEREIGALGDSVNRINNAIRLAYDYACRSLAWTMLPWIERRKQDRPAVQDFVKGLLSPAKGGKDKEASP